MEDLYNKIKKILYPPPKENRGTSRGRSGHSKQGFRLSKKNANLLPKGYDPDRVLFIVEQIATNGGSLGDIAAALGINRTTLYFWRKKYKELDDKIMVSQALANIRVANMLFARAVGYEHKEDKVFCYRGKPVVVSVVKRHPPDIEACKFFLTNRNPSEWKNKTTIAGETDSPLSIDVYIGRDKHGGQDGGDSG